LLSEWNLLLHRQFGQPAAARNPPIFPTYCNPSLPRPFLRPLAEYAIFVMEPDGSTTSHVACCVVKQLSEFIVGQDRDDLDHWQ
jgi:hypothetical protein